MKLSHLQQLEAEAIFVIREVVEQFSNPVMLFSGGKDSIVLAHLSRKAFWPSKIPYPFLHIDTGHNFEETLMFRDMLMSQLDIKLIVGKVQDTIDKGMAEEEKGLNISRNALQTVTLLDTIRSLNVDAAIGGARRDEEKSRAKERFFSLRNSYGQWCPENQRPELWKIFNSRKNEGEHFRVFPISNWTEMDVWHYIAKEKIAVPSLYFTHKRKVVERHNIWLPESNYISLLEGEQYIEKRVRFRTIGDMTCTGAIESNASNVQEVINEIASLHITERGGRVDDKKSDAAMEDRKKEGYF